MATTSSVFRMGYLGIVFCALLAACWGPAPGRGEKAEHGFASAPPVIVAIERYRSARGQYPVTLEALVPDFLPRQALLHGPAQVGYPWEYGRDSTGYTLTFRYTGPGMNSCHYSPAEPRWKCGGYF
jgi:hypothetical protein